MIPLSALSAIFLFAFPVLAESGSDYRLDLSRYFPDEATEASSRQALSAKIDAFAKEKPRDAAALEAYLDRGQTLLADLARRMDYLRLLSSIDIQDHAALSGRDEASALYDRVDGSIAQTLAGLMPQVFAADVKKRPSLDRKSVV